MLQKMLYPTDLSESSRAVLNNLEDLRKVGVESVGILFVINIAKLSGVSGGIDIENYIEGKTERADELLPGIADKIERSGMKVEILKPYPVGNPVAEILKASENYNFIAMGARGMSTFKKILLGSVSEGVLQDSRIPVYIFKSGVERLFGRILVAYDFSEWSERALEYAKFVAKRYGGELHILHVSEPESRSADLRVLEEIVRAEGINVSAHLAAGTPHKVILSFIEKINATTVFMGSRGLGGVKSLILGSTSESVVRRSPVPVFVSK